MDALVQLQLLVVITYAAGFGSDPTHAAHIFQLPLLILCGILADIQLLSLFFLLEFRAVF